mmetsp:Transcript_15858/g.45263  ORF Transcript_15858/g.45263 Transcript_15858/m.45263 type:complete len:360 (+) Transcript_15858:646-1725(+)
MPRGEDDDGGRGRRGLRGLLQQERLKGRPPLLPAGGVAAGRQDLAPVPVDHVLRRPAVREHRVPRHAVGLPADREVQAAVLLQQALRPVEERPPPALLAGRGEVREVHERRPVHAARAGGPGGVAVGQVLQKFHRHRRDENAVVRHVHAHAVPEGLERGAVVHGQRVATAGPDEAVHELDEALLAQPHEQLDRQVAQRLVERGQPRDARLVQPHPRAEVGAPLLGDGHGHLARLRGRQEKRLYLGRLAELVAELLVHLARQHHDVVERRVQLRHLLAQPAPQVLVPAEPEPHVVGGGGQPQVHVVQQVAQGQHEREAAPRGRGLPGGLPDGGVREAAEGLVRVGVEVGEEGLDPVLVVL